MRPVQRLKTNLSCRSLPPQKLEYGEDMKRLFGLGALALSLSSCLVIVDTNEEGQFSSGRFVGGYVKTNTSEYYVCGAKDTQVSVVFSFTGDIERFYVELYGKNNPNTIVRKPASGFVEVSSSEASSKEVVFNFTYAASDVHPLKSDGARTQAVIVTPVPVPNPQVALGATKIRVVAEDGLGNERRFDVPGELAILTDQNPECN
jgi:hypothetical protein